MRRSVRPDISRVPVPCCWQRRWRDRFGPYCARKSRPDGCHWRDWRVGLCSYSWVLSGSERWIGELVDAVLVTAAAAALVLSTAVAVVLGVTAERYLAMVPLKLIAGIGFVEVGRAP